MPDAFPQWVQKQYLIRAQPAPLYPLNGLVLDWPQYFKGKYGTDPRAAERAGRGIWKCSFPDYPAPVIARASPYP